MEYTHIGSIASKLLDLVGTIIHIAAGIVVFLLWGCVVGKG